MNRSAAAFWRTAVLGFWILAVANVALVGYAWLRFVQARPDYLDHAWPTFSRVLSQGDLSLYRLLAAIGSVGLFLGASAVAAMIWQRARSTPTLRPLLIAMTGCAIAAALLSVPHYLHVWISLRMNNGVHMLVSYIFFVGMTLVIGVYDRCVARVERHTGHGLLAGAQHRLAAAVFVAGVLFLSAFLLKDRLPQPWSGYMQKTFVAMEIIWTIIVQTYGITFVPVVRAFFRGDSARETHARRAAAQAASAVVVCAVLALLGAPLPAEAAQPTGVGGTGRIQPAGGVIALAGAPGRAVESVHVKEGEHVHKGTVLVVLSDRSLRQLEKDVAAERLRTAELQATELGRALELEVEAARLTLENAKADAASIASLDERTMPVRERRQRAAAVAQAEVALKLAQAKQQEARTTRDAELRIARMNLKLAEANLATTRIVAPVDGTVLELFVQPGSTTTGGPALTLADTSTMYVITDFFEGDLPKLARGQRVTVSNAALGHPLEGAVDRIGRVVDPVNRLARVWVRLDRATPADRFIGMQVDVKVNTERVAAK